jgi:hypothetical protein
LVEMLASKNLASRISDGGPGPGEYGRHEFPKCYDPKAQAVVYLARQQLLAEGAAAFDVLVAHFNDERYSYSSRVNYYSDSEECNLSVGEVCRMIVVCTVECYDDKIYLLTPDQVREHLDHYRARGLAKWWQANRHRPLWEIQVEALDKTIRFMESVDREKCTKWHPQEPRLPAKEFEAHRKENLRLLKAKRDYIASCKEPYRPKAAYYPVLMLPWDR